MADNPFEKKQSDRALVAVNLNEQERAAFQDLERYYGLKRSALVKRLLADAFSRMLEETGAQWKQ